MVTDEEKLTMTDAEYRSYRKAESEKEKSLKKNKQYQQKLTEVRQKKTFLQEKKRIKERIRLIRAQFKPLQKPYSSLGQESGYFKNKPENKKTKYLGFI